MSEKQRLLEQSEDLYQRWESLLASMSEAEITAPTLSDGQSVRDTMLHLWFWHQMSLARMEAALAGRQPQFPPAPPQFDLDTENDVDGINAWIAETYRERSWSEVHQMWRTNFRTLIELGKQCSEADVIDKEKYPFMRGYSIGDMLISEHHEEHYQDVARQCLNRPR